MGKAAASTRVLLEYSLISISGCKFPFPVAVFLQPIDNFTPSVQRENLKISLWVTKIPTRCAFRNAAGTMLADAKQGLSLVDVILVILWKLIDLFLKINFNSSLPMNSQ